MIQSSHNVRQNVIGVAAVHLWKKAGCVKKKNRLPHRPAGRPKQAACLESPAKTDRHAVHVTAVGAHAVPGSRSLLGSTRRTFGRWLPAAVCSALARVDTLCVARRRSTDANLHRVAAQKKGAVLERYHQLKGPLVDASFARRVARKRQCGSERAWGGGRAGGGAGRVAGRRR